MTTGIEEWLAGINLPQYSREFKANHIDVETVATLTDADLRELGVASLGHRKSILTAASRHLADASAGETLPVRGGLWCHPESRAFTILIDEEPSRDLTDDLPVVVAIGINYGQGGEYLGRPFIKGVFDVTKMRRRFENAVASIGTAACDIRDLQTGYHLVAANFFPWITAVSWREHGFNAIEEALFIRCFGYSDPFWHLLDLLDTLVTADGGTRYWLVFHGAQNAVPYMAVELLAHLQNHKNWGARLEPKLEQIIFSDNLAYPPPVYNAVKLCRRRVSREDVTADLTE